MSEDNPYAPPAIDLDPVSFVMTDGALADRWARLNAAIVDGIVGACYGLPTLYLLGYFNYTGPDRQPPVLLTLSAVLLQFAGFLLVNGHLLKNHGQTVGKYLMGIRIADLRGNVPSFALVSWLRYLPLSLLTLSPNVGGLIGLVDALFIFRPDRRCLHDLLAGTKVLKVRS